MEEEQPGPSRAHPRGRIKPNLALRPAGGPLPTHAPAGDSSGQERSALETASQIAQSSGLPEREPQELLAGDRELHSTLVTDGLGNGDTDTPAAKRAHPRGKFGPRFLEKGKLSDGNNSASAPSNCSSARSNDASGGGEMATESGAPSVAPSSERAAVPVPVGSSHSQAEASRHTAPQQIVAQEPRTDAHMAAASAAHGEPVR